MAFTYQWERCDSGGASCVFIPGATSPTYVLTAGDVGSTIRVIVSDGITTATSGPTAVIGSAPAPAILRSGFEAATSLAAAVNSPAQNGYQLFHGIDAVTGFNWDTGRFYGSTWKIHTILQTTGGTPPGLTTDYIRNSIETVTGPYGTPTKALKLAFGKQSPSTDIQQTYIASNSLVGAVTSYYCRYWARLNPELQAQADSQGTAYWRAFWEFKTWLDYRVNLYIFNNQPPGPTWYMQADNQGWQTDAPAVVKWAVNSPVKVPLDQWFAFEIYLKRSTGNDGQFYVAVNSQQIVNRMGPNYGPNHDEIAILPHNILYGHYKHDCWTMIENLEILDAPPGPLPCGPPTF